MRGIAGALLIASLLAGCGGATGGDPDTLVVNNNAEPQTLDPGIQKGNPEHHINIALFEGLTNRDPKDLSPQPGVAESWESAEENTVYTFHLRPAKWSNGDPLTAHDFEWSWKRVLDPGLASEYFEQIANYVKHGKAYYHGAAADLTLKGWSEVKVEQKSKDAAALVEQVQKRHAGAIRKLLETEKEAAVTTSLRKALDEAARRDDVTLDQVGVRARDDRTLVVTLEASTPYFLDLVGFFTYYPVNRRIIEKHGKDWTSKEFVGNGPYRMKEWKTKQHVLIEKNPHYWDAGRVPNHRIKFLPFEDLSTAFNRYEKGEIHWLTDVPRQDIEKVLKRPDFHRGPMLTTYFYGFNLKRTVTADKRVRQALARAIDKKQICEFILRAGEIPADSVVPPGMAGYTPATMTPFDPVAARKLLAEAGYPDGKGFPKLELLYNTHETHKNIAAAIQEMWRTHLNVQIELRNVEWKVYLDMQSRLEFDVLRRAWVADYNDPNTFIDMFTAQNGMNNTGFANAAYDALVFGAMKERDPAKRLKMLRDAEAILMDELPIVPIYFYVTKNMWKPSVQGLYDNVRDEHPLNRVHVSGQAP